MNIINTKNILITSKYLLLSITKLRTHEQVVRRWKSIITSKRPPVVTIMGHVDHGKTTLLDHLRNSQIVKQEFGGITQHIGAFVVPFKNQKDQKELVTFLDTPGHAAFASMRRRGANITDIVVLVVACDDGVLDQTVESIRFAKESQVPIIVAANKIDKYNDKKLLDKNIATLRSQLIVHDVICEPDGGDVQLIKISALKGTGVEDLKEAILAQAETLELKTELDCMVSGRVIESKLDNHKGKVCTILVQRGVLNKGDCIIAGYNWAKVRSLFDERNLLQQSCGPGLPIQVTGWRENQIPSAGDEILQVVSEAEAKKVIHKLNQERLKDKAQNDAEAAALRYEDFYKIYKEKLKEKRESGNKYGRIYFTKKGIRPKESDKIDEDNKINLILKCDVDGSLEVLLQLLDTYDKDNKQHVKLDVMHFGVGNITDNDLTLAQSFNNSVIYGFNVKPANQNIFTQAKKSGVGLKFFNVIYHLIDDLKERLGEKLPELEQEVVVAQADVIQEFIVKDGRKRVHVAGCRCSKGTLKKDLIFRLLRNREVIADELNVYTLKHLKEDVKEIEKDRECGISFTLHETEFKPGDVLEGYQRLKYKPKLNWNMKGFN